MAITLRDGSTTEDKRLDRVVQFDERSRDFPITAIVPEKYKRGRTWSVPAHLDQGREGACVGFGVSHELAAYPAAVEGVTDDFARNIYHAAQKIDEYPGENYSGTSVLAGTKIAQGLGYFDEYRWCFSVDEILRALAHEGPVVVGTKWYAGMYEPDENGLLHPGGKVSGGHCYLIRGFALKPNFADGPVFRIRNSWGADWGKDGDAFIKVSDYAEHLMPESDAVVFVGRHKQPEPKAAEVKTPTAAYWPRATSAPAAGFGDPLRYWHR